MADRVGQRLGNYTIIKLLGQGGFAEVYLGEHFYLKSQAAMKVLQARLSSQDDMDSFLKEAQTIASLSHPNIVRVMDFGVDNEVPYLVMDYAPNGTLRQRHAKGEALPLEVIVPYVRQVADALQYAHDERLIHRDIKPENMLVGRRNEILLSDFGIALVAQSSLSQGTQDVIGTVAYMSPEQIQGKPRPASDQYLLGVVVYEWLTGERPFRGSFTEMCTQHMFAQPPLLREKLNSVSPEVERVVMTALAKDPKQRFENIQEFARALEQIGQPVQTSQQSGSAQSASSYRTEMMQQPSASFQTELMQPSASYQTEMMQPSQQLRPPTAFLPSGGLPSRPATQNMSSPNQPSQQASATNQSQSSGQPSGWPQPTGTGQPSANPGQLTAHSSPTEARTAYDATAAQQQQANAMGQGKVTLPPPPQTERRQYPPQPQQQYRPGQQGPYPPQQTPYGPQGQPPYGPQGQGQYPQQGQGGAGQYPPQSPYPRPNEMQQNALAQQQQMRSADSLAERERERERERNAAQDLAAPPRRENPSAQRAQDSAGGDSWGILGTYKWSILATIVGIILFSVLHNFDPPLPDNFPIATLRHSGITFVLLCTTLLWAAFGPIVGILVAVGGVLGADMLYPLDYAAFHPLLSTAHGSNWWAPLLINGVAGLATGLTMLRKRKYPTVGSSTRAMILAAIGLAISIGFVLYNLSNLKNFPTLGLIALANIVVCYVILVVYSIVIGLIDPAA